MDSITAISEEEKMAIDDGKESITEDLLGGEKLRLDVREENNKEKKKEICVCVSEQNMVKREMLDNDTAFSGNENQMESSSQLNERGDEDDDVATTRNTPGKEGLSLMREGLKRIDEEEKIELRKDEEEINRMEEREMEDLEMEYLEMEEWEKEELEREMKELEREELKRMKELEYDEFDWEMEEHMKFMKKKERKQRGKGKAMTMAQKQDRKKVEAPKNATDAAHLLGVNFNLNINKINLNIEETEPIENDEDKKNKSEDESDIETGVKLSDWPLKENWEDPSDDESSTSLESSNKEIDPEEPKLKESKARSCQEKKDKVKLRSPVICVLGHVDTGKTKLLDFIRKTHVQDAEAGGITQQIGATMIPQEALREKCKMANDFSTFDLKLPGLLVIDTPGHESFRNLRSRGTSMCDIAVLVVDIMHGLEHQTIESINLLKDSKTPFIVALNKVDRLYGWKSSQDSDVESTVNRQSPITQNEFKKRCQEVIAQFANEYLNAALFYENPDSRTFVSIVPTSAISGDGMGNLMSLIAKLSQTRIHKKLVFSQELKATVLEVKPIPGLGTTVDVILVNGRLKEGDTIVMAGREGPIVGQIRSLLTPHPLKEMRVKNPYVKHKSIEGAQGVKITGTGLEMAIAGLPLFVAREPSDVESLKEKADTLIKQVAESIKTSDLGVYVQASTLGSLEAFLEHLTSRDIPYFAVKIGPVVKKDVMKASVMLERDIQYATILAFNVKVEREAQEFADAVGVKVIAEELVYHAGDEFLKHREKCLKKKEEALSEAVFPCICKVLTSGKQPFVVLVEEGYLRVGTPLLVRDRGNLELGVVKSISAADGPSVDMARAGDKVEIQMKDTKEAFQVRAEERLISQISRKSYELCKKYCKKDFSKEELDLMLELRRASNKTD